MTSGNDENQVSHEGKVLSDVNGEIRNKKCERKKV